MTAPSFPVRAEDALFLHVQTDHEPQQVGAVVMLGGPGPDLADLRSSVAVRVTRLPQLRRRLIPARGQWDRPHWVVEDAVDVGSRVTEVTAADDGSLGPLEREVGRYFAEPLDPAGAAWKLLLVRVESGRLSAIVVKAHHALGDSYALISTLSGLFDPLEGPSPARADRAGRAGRAGRGGRAGRPPRAVARTAALMAAPRQVLRVAHGLVGMSLAEPPDPPRPVAGAGGAVTHGREFAAISLDSRAVSTTARRLGAGTADLVLALIAEALGQLMTDRGEANAGRAVRAMVPCTLRVTGRRTGSRSAPDETDAGPGADRAVPGNRTSGVLLDLPVGPMSLAGRVAAVRAVRDARLHRGDADAAGFVLRAMNLLPPPLQRAIARTAFTSRRFSLIVSVFPGIRRTRHVLGAEVTGVFPVLALADGVGLALGAMTWGSSLSIGLMANPALIPDARLLVAGIENAFVASERGAAG
jgi:diacylglycerol O-acyltransferase / wax synthase